MLDVADDVVADAADDAEVNVVEMVEVVAIFVVDDAVEVVVVLAVLVVVACAEPMIARSSGAKVWYWYIGVRTPEGVISDSVSEPFSATM